MVYRYTSLHPVNSPASMWSTYSFHRGTASLLKTSFLSVTRGLVCTCPPPVALTILVREMSPAMKYNCLHTIACMPGCRSFNCEVGVKSPKGKPQRKLGKGGEGEIGHPTLPHTQDNEGMFEFSQSDTIGWQFSDMSSKYGAAARCVSCERV